MAKGRSVELFQQKVKTSPGYDERISKLQSVIDQQNKTLDELKNKSNDVKMDMTPILSMLEKQNQIIMKLLNTKQTPQQAPVVTVNNQSCGYKFEIQRNNRGQISEMMAYPVNSEGKY